MKHFILFVTCFTALSAIGQITPFKYKNKSFEKSQFQKIDNNEFRKYEDSLEKDKKLDTSHLQEVVVSGRTYKNYYFQFEAKFKAIAESKSLEISEKYAFHRQELLKKLNDELDGRKLEKIKEELEYLDDKMKEEMTLVKELQLSAKEMNYKGRNLNNLKLFPVRNTVDAQLFYDYYAKDKKAQFLKNSLISFSSEGSKASIFNELYADYYGPIRFGVGALLSNTNTETTIDSTAAATIDSTSIQKDAVQRLLGGGGNVVFNFGFPLFGYTSSSQNFSFKLVAAPKFSFDVPKIGTSNEKYSTNLDLGLEGSFFYTGVLDVLTFYTNFRLAHVSGNANFYNSLVKPDNKSFFFNQTSIGIALNSTFRVSWNFYWGDSFVKDNFPSNISFSIVPN